MSLLLRALGIAAAVLAAGAARSLRSGERDYASETYGFRVERPDDSWSFTAQTGAKDSKLELHVALDGRGGAVEVVVHALPRLEESTAEELRASAERRLAVQSGVGSIERFEARIAGREAPGLDMRYTAPGGGSWRVRQHYLGKPGIAYVLESHAPVDEWDQHARDFERILDSFALLPESAARSFDVRLLALAARCGSELDWAPSWDAAAQRARDAKKPVLVLVWAYPGFEITDSARTSTFMDEDVVALVRERFVPLRLENGMEAPLRDAAVYGTGPHTFGAALLVVAPGGSVLAETSTLEPSSVHAFLRDVLAERPEYPGEPMPEETDRAARAELHVRRGEHRQALELLREPAGAREQLVLATVHRREGRGDAALAAVDAALAVCASEEKGAILLEKSAILVGLGRDREAIALLERILTGPAAAPELPAALFARGVMALGAGGREGAERFWRRLVTDHPQSRWAWLAAAAWKSTALALGVVPRTAWPPADVLATARSVPRAPLGAGAARDAATGALGWLIAAQRTDGSWASPSEISASRDDSIDPFVDAYTALAARALLAERARPEARAAVEKALRFLVASHARASAAPDSAAFMDYTVWSRSATLWLFADALAAKVGEREKLRPVMREMVASLKAKQRPGGGWTYYLAQDLSAETKPSDVSISFVTAFASLALQRAHEAGIDVPKAVKGGALDCLEAMRAANGAFTYMQAPGAQSGDRNESIPGAAGRGPVCELALLRGGRGSAERVRAALTLFVEHREGLAHELGKALMHAGPDGQGCHYILFDYATAALALGALSAKEREPLRTHVLELVLAARRADGSFQDTSVLGPACGTALALLALQDLAEPPR